MLDYDALSSIVRRENNSQALMALPRNFYSEVAILLRSRLDALKEFDNPRSSEAKQLEDEIIGIQSFSNSLFQRRLEKIIQFAALEANSTNWTGSSPVNNMMPSEKRLYDVVIQGIIETKKEQLGYMCDEVP